VQSVDRLLTGVRLDAGRQLRDPDGALVVLRLAGLTRDDVAPRRPGEPSTGEVRMLVFDDLLAGPPTDSGTSGFPALVAEMLGARYAGLDFRVSRRSTPDPDCQGIERFLYLQRALGSGQANIVVLACQPQSVVNGVPLDDFERTLSASLDYVLGRTRAEAVVVTPPPIPGMPGAARPYARVAKQVGLRKGVPVVDIYSRLLLTDGWEDMFRPSPGRYASYNLYPVERGQGMIAEEVYAAIVELCHDGLSAVHRKAALMGNGG
jgi:hypothetical protein